MSEALVRQYCNVAGLALLIYDQILNWEQEVRYIWNNSEWFINSSFFFSRYLALAIQIVNIVHSTPSVLQQRNGRCLPWFTFQTVSVVLLLCNMEMIMMVRVYALYDQSRTFGAFLLAWFIICRALNIWLGKDSMQEIEVDVLCIPKRTPESTKWFSLMVIVNQCVLWFLTNQRYRSTMGQRWSKHPIVRLVMRDNYWTCIVLSGVFVSLLPYSLYVEQLGHVIFSLLTCILSIMSCRLVLNMRSLKHDGEEDFDPEFSTVISLPSGDSRPFSESPTASSH